MRIRTILASGLVCAVSVCAQNRKFSWQNSCFNNPGLPYCQGRDFAVKRTPMDRDPAIANSLGRDAGPLSNAPQVVSPTLIVVGAIDWKFADPQADTLVGFNYSDLATSQLARAVIAKLAANQGLADADVQKIFDGLAGATHVAFSLRGDQAV